MMIWWSLLSAANAQDTFFVSVRNNNWNVVFRSSSSGSRIERLAGRCGGDWVNACAFKYGPGQRTAALRMGPPTGASSCHAIALAPMDASGLQSLVMQIDVANFCNTLVPGSRGPVDFLSPPSSADPTLRPPPDDDLDFLLDAPDPPLPEPTRPSATPGLMTAPNPTVQRGQAPLQGNRTSPPTTVQLGGTSPPPPSPPLGGYVAPPNEPAVVQQALSMDELRMLEADLDTPKPVSEAERKRRAKEERKRRRKGEATELRDRTVPGL